MTATFSTYALETMGFRDLLGKGSLVVSFMSVTVYEAHGITLPNGFTDARKARVAGSDYRIALAESVNTGCQRLIGDDFTESESDWLKEVKASGPFVLIAVGPTDFIECEAGRMMRTPDNGITTYDSFPIARETLKSLEDRILPPAVAALTLALNESDCYVALRKLARESVGRTPDGTAVHDIRLDIHGKMTAFRLLEEARAVEILDASIERAPRLHQSAAKYFALGTAENDQLKKFLFFFLSLEVETHAVFGRIDYAQSLKNQVFRDGAGPLRPSAAHLMIRDVAKSGNLFDRFVWCATCSWKSLADDEIKLFKELKNARDAIAHGRASEPPPGFARKAELLAQKILWGQEASSI